MNYYQAYNYILSLSNFPRKEYMKDPRHCSIYLKRLQWFLDILGNPEKQIPHYIHVAGTSGKGSTTAMLHSILNSAGKTTGSTYSPHPTCITERWKLGNRYMTKKEFVELVEYIKPKLDEYIRTTPYDMLSFFEITEAIGFVWFARHKVDWLVLETACGGRYDSSNIIPHKDVAVITNIGLDHVGIIGNNKAEIAYEKAGIIKPGGKAFTAERDKKILDIIRKECEKNKVELNHVTYNIKHVTKFDINGIAFKYRNSEYHIPVIGEHQVGNSILCIEVAKSLGIPEQAIKQGLAKIKLPLAMEVVSKKPLIILDSAHNPDKIKTTVKTIQQIIKLSNCPINLIVGFSADKDLTKLVKQLTTLKPKTVICTRNTINPFRKVADPQEIAKKIKKYSPQTKVEIFLDPAEAFKSAKSNLKNNEILLVTGSIFLSGELRPLIKS